MMESFSPITNRDLAVTVDFSRSGSSIDVGLNPAIWMANLMVKPSGSSKQHDEPEL